ncbi:MAG: hypothetical protein P1V35_10965 [Planctomycetota bacterium]|nr:hypothetical protein [Planctomycetota bacterium]
MTGRLESDPQLALRSGIEALHEITLQQDGLQKEWRDAWAQFSQDEPPFEKAQLQGSSACGRFREWFLLERHSPSLLGTPMDRLINAWREYHPEFTDHVEPLLQSSFTGIFEVGDLVENQGAWLRDITGFGEFALQEQAGAPALQTGDLLVGRLFSIPGSLHVASGSAVWLRSPDLSKALERDLNRLYGEGAKILRLAAPELESMFFHPAAPHKKAQRAQQENSATQSKAAIGEAQEFLTLAGWSSADIRTWFAAVEKAPLDPNALAAGPDDPVGQALEQFAFETKVDLSEARRILTQAWMAVHTEKNKPKQSGKSATPASAETQAAVDRFAAAQAVGGDMERHFQELEESLGLPVGSDDEDPGKAPDFPGVVGAMVAEFQWDQDRQGKGDATRVQRLQPFAEFNRSIAAFEDLGRREVLTFCCFWTLEQGLFSNGSEAKETVQALEQFTHWAQEEHEMSLFDECETLLGDLHSDLPRIVGINQRLPEQDALATSETGQLFSIGEAESNHDPVVLLDRSGNRYTCHVPDVVRADLKVGDYLRADLDMEGNAQVYCIYPPQASELNA